VAKTYKKPPVVEAWIEFHFEYGEEAPKWDQNVTTQFINSFGEQFDQKNQVALFAKEVKIGEQGPVFSQSDPILHRLKIFNKTKDRCLQVEQKLLVYNMLRNGTDWPGFSILLQEVLPIHQQYLDAFHPVKIRKVVLNYRDHIMVPFENESIEPKDYFEIYPNIPPKMGNMAHYSLSLVLSDICKDGIAQFSVRTKPCIIDETKPKLPFIIDWNVHSTISFACNDKISYEAWLNTAHDGVSQAFKECLTEKCRGLFS
jgi:uncharacterized protein (TIGR04255 family)